MLDNGIDYIFTDPPFGDNLMYSELNFLWESWLKAFTNNKSEAIINKVQEKGLNEYQTLMEESFKECYRILKPGRWMTVEFHNSKNTVWNAIQEAILNVGFIIADIRVLDKQQGSFKQVTTTSAVKKDLIISAYKPKDEFLKKFLSDAGTEESCWNFVREHLSNLPVCSENDKNELQSILERQKHLLFDRMIAFHIQKGLSIPISSADFYRKLQEKFIERDDMYFLSEQSAEYDRKKINSKGIEQYSLYVSDESSAIQWLGIQLDKESQTYQEIQPKFLQELKKSKYEKLPELIEMLEQNFLKDDNGKWYVPDVNKQSDLDKLREKTLLKEFNEYRELNKKLKKVRIESLRAGFKNCWDNKDYKTIIDVAKNIPEIVIQDDPKLFMYYKNSLTRTED